MTDPGVMPLPCPNPWCEHTSPPEVNGPFQLKRCIRCGYCGLEGPWADTEAEAITAWNLRTPDLRKRVEELERALRFICQTVHQAYHEGAIADCQKNTCDAGGQALKGAKP